MAQPYSTGAGHIFVGIGAQFSPVYLGTAMDRPIIEGRPNFEAIMNDLYGGSAGAPFDFSFLGQVDVISVSGFNRFNWAVFRSLTKFPNPTGTPGLFLPGDIGTIMGLENMAAPVWVQFPYATKTAMSPMEQGRHYFQSVLFDPHQLRVGTRAAEIGLIWLCFMKFNAPNQQIGLWDGDMSGLPPVN